MQGRGSARALTARAADVGHAAARWLSGPQLAHLTCPPPPRSLQALLAMGLLELRPWKPRTVGLLGIIASIMNCCERGGDGQELCRPGAWERALVPMLRELA